MKRFVKKIPFKITQIKDVSDRNRITPMSTLRLTHTGNERKPIYTCIYALCRKTSWKERDTLNYVQYVVFLANSSWWAWVSPNDRSVMVHPLISLTAVTSSVTEDICTCTLSLVHFLLLNFHHIHYRSKFSGR